MSKRRAVIDDDSSDDDDDALVTIKPVVAAPATTAAAPPANKVRLLDESDDSDDSDEPVAKKKPVEKPVAVASKSIKRPADSSDDESDDDDDDDDDSDDDSEEDSDREDNSRKKSRPAPKPKKKKAKKRKNLSSMLIETEAGVGDSDEEDEFEDDDDLQESRLALKAARDNDPSNENYNKRLAKRDEFLAQSAEEIADDIRRRNAQMNTAQGSINWGGSGIESREANLPTVTDPRLFLVKCAKGKEQSLCIQLISMFKHMRGKPGCPEILSVTAPGVDEFIYVEAKNESQAQQPLVRLRGAFGRRITMVPIKEMTEALTISEVKRSVKPGDLVRLRRAPYKGDIARVAALNDAEDRATVHYMPRLDLVALGLPIEERRARMKQHRPVKKLFNRDEVEQMEGIVENGNMRGNAVDEFQGEHFYKGFVQKEIGVAQLQIKDVDPTMEELQLFRALSNPGGSSSNGRGGADDAVTQAIEDGKLFEQLGAMQATGGGGGVNKQTSFFAEGDNVRVKDGDLQDLVGKILSIDSTKQTVKIQLVHEEVRGKHIDLPASQLMKFFSVGNHVKVLGGLYAGETGNVVKVNSFTESAKEWVAVVFTDTGKEINVLFRDLRVSEERNAGLDSLGGYKMFDILVLASGQIGCVVSVGSEELGVLLQTGVVRGTRLSEVQGARRPSRFDSALDRTNRAVRANDVVKVVQGQNRGIEGIVKFVVRSVLFIHSRAKTKDAGMFVENSVNVQLAGTQVQAPVTGLGNGSKRAARPSRGGRGGRGGGAAGGDSDADNLCGKQVRIRSGRYKSYLGVVVSATDTIVRVEIHGRPKVVNLPRDKVQLANFGAAGGRGGGMSGSTPDHGGYVPAFHGAVGSATPLGGATPLHGASATPLHGSAGGSTPMREPSTPGAANEPWNAAVNSAIPATPSDVWAPDSSSRAGGSSYMPATPGFMGPPTVATPAAFYGAGSYTPAPQTPATPGGDFGGSGGAGVGGGFKKGDRLRVTSGSHAGQFGEFVDIAGSDAVVKLDQVGDYKILALAILTHG